MQPGWEFIDHTADYALRARGRDFRELLESAATGLARLMADTADLAPTEVREVEVTGQDREEVLVHLLKELLYLEDDGLLPVEVRVLESGETWARARVGAVPLADHADRLAAAVKAVTYHGLQVRPEGDGLVVEIVFDA